MRSIRKRPRIARPLDAYGCFLSSTCLIHVLEFVGTWECLNIARVSRAWSRIVHHRIKQAFSLKTLSNLLRPALTITTRCPPVELEAIMAGDGRHVLIIRKGNGYVYQSSGPRWKEAHSSIVGAAEFLGTGRLFLLKKTLRDQSAEVYLTTDWTRYPDISGPQFANMQPIGVDGDAVTMFAQYTPRSQSTASCEMRVIRVDIASGASNDTNICLYSGRQFAQERIMLKGNVPATRILIRRNPTGSDQSKFYRTPVLISTESQLKNSTTLSFSELAHLVSPCGRWLSCGCWLTNPNHGVSGAWFTASLFDLRNSEKGVTKRIDFSDCYRNSIISSFSADGNYVLLGWRARHSNLPWQSMDIFDVKSLFRNLTNGEPKAKPLCKLTRDLRLSGDPSTRLAMTWAGQYILMAEVSGVSILDPHQNGALLAIVRARDLCPEFPGTSRSRILNIFCHGRVALQWTPTNRSCTVGSLMLCELLTRLTLLTIGTRVPFSDNLGETVYVSNDCRTVSVKSLDNTIRVFDCNAVLSENVFID